MDEQGRRTRGGRKKAGVVAVAVILALCLLAVMSYRSSHSISGASCSSAITEDSGAASAKHMVALEVTAGNQTASGITAKSQMARASTMASQTAAKTTAVNSIVEETFEFGTLRGSAEAVALFKKSLQTGEPYYLNGEPTPVYKAQAGKTIMVNPTKAQMLVDLRHYAQELRDGTYKNSEHFNTSWSRRPNGTYIAGGYSDAIDNGRKWLQVGPYQCFPDAVVPGIEQTDKSELFGLKFPVHKDEFSFAVNDDMTVVYVRNDKFVQIHDFERDNILILTKGGDERVLENVIPGSAYVYKGWGDTIIFAYQTEENGEALYKLYRLTRGAIIALYEKETIVGMRYDEMGVYIMFDDGRTPPEAYLAIRVDDGIKIQSLGGIVIGTVSEDEYYRDGDGAWFFVRELFSRIHPRHAEAVGVPGYYGWNVVCDPDGWTRPTGPDDWAAAVKPG